MPVFPSPILPLCDGGVIVGVMEAVAKLSCVASLVTAPGGTGYPPPAVTEGDGLGVTVTVTFGNGDCGLAKAIAVSVTLIPLNVKVTVWVRVGKSVRVGPVVGDR